MWTIWIFLEGAHPSLFINLQDFRGVPTPHFSSTQRFSGGAYPLLFINLQDFRGVPTPYISSTKRFSEGAHPLLFINPKGTWTRTWEFWIWINPKGCPPLTFINLKVFRGVSQRPLCNLDWCFFKANFLTWICTWEPGPVHGNLDPYSGTWT